MRAARMARDVCRFIGRTDSSFHYEGGSNCGRISTSTFEVLTLEGDLCAERVKALREALLKCFKEGKVNIILDFSKTGKMEYLAIGVLVERCRQARYFGGDIVLVGMSAYLEKLFRVVGVYTLFSIHPTTGDALSYFDVEPHKAAG